MSDQEYGGQEYGGGEPGYGAETQETETNEWGGYSETYTDNGVPYTETEHGGGSEYGGDGGGGEAQTYAMFELKGGGIGVMPDPDDNPNNNDVVRADSGVRVSFEVCNVGNAAGTARVDVEIDDTWIGGWESEQLEPGQCTYGYVSVGRLSEGEHTALDYVNPGSGQNDHETNTFTVEPGT
jgi:hypothetical protein